MGNLGGDHMQWCLAKKSEISRCGNVGQAALTLSVVELQLDFPALVAVLLPEIEVLEYLLHHGLFNQVGDTQTGSIAVFYQGNHSARRFWCTAVIMGTLPEAALITCDTGDGFFQIRKIRPPDQGAIAENPLRLICYAVSPLETS